MMASTTGRTAIPSSVHMMNVDDLLNHRTRSGDWQTSGAIFSAISSTWATYAPPQYGSTRTHGSAGIDSQNASLPVMSAWTALVILTGGWSAAGLVLRARWPRCRLSRWRASGSRPARSRASSRSAGGAIASANASCAAAISSALNPDSSRPEAALADTSSSVSTGAPCASSKAGRTSGGRRPAVPRSGQPLSLAQARISAACTRSRGRRASAIGLLEYFQPQVVQVTLSTGAILTAADGIPRLCPVDDVL